MGKRILRAENINKTIRYLRNNGVKHAYYAAKERIEVERGEQYLYEEPEQEVLAAQREGWKQFPYRFSIVVPAYETRKEFLYELIDSIRAQSYERWELIIADAGSGTQVEDIVTWYQENKQERRIRYLRLVENRGISENTNVGLAEATGEYIGLLDHDDVLAPDALYEMAAAIAQAQQEGKHPALIYSDEDKIEAEPEAVSGKSAGVESAEGKFVAKRRSYHYLEPNRKYDFNLDLLLSNNYICHFMMMEAGLLKKLKLRRTYDGAQDYDLALRTVNYLLSSGDLRNAGELGEKILHVPKALYHWRKHEASTAASTASKAYAYEAGKAALENFCKKRGWKVQVSHSLHRGFYQIAYLPDMFTVRPEVGMIGGRVLDKQNKITSGIYNEKGEKLYQGVYKEYSGGRTHRAALVQDCAAVDIRCLRLRQELQPLFKEITGVTYRETTPLGIADVSGISCDEAGYQKLSMALGKAVAQAGYLIVWNPGITVKTVKNAK
ncbi:MAG: glycosyltransferase [Muribaculaceae bacterium]|nr:glycosyltransferase [Muribaculaceae bacterium]